MNGKHAESKGANGLRAWIRRNDGVLIVGAIIIAGVQYQATQTAALTERQRSLRIASIERSQQRIAEQREAHMTRLETAAAASLAAFAESHRQTAEQLGLRITAVQENQNRLAGQLDLRVTDAQANQDRLADRLGQRISSVEKNRERVAGQLGARIGSLETCMASLKTRMTGMETSMAGLETRMTALENSVTAIQRGQDPIAERGAPITSPERSAAADAADARGGPTGTDAPPGARTPGPDEGAAEFADGMNPRLGRIENEPGLPPPEAPG